MRALYQVIAQTIQARDNCQKTIDTCNCNENTGTTCNACHGRVDWYDRHQEKLDSIARDLLPSGSGIDTGTKIHDDSKPERLILTMEYHHMNEAGFYDGWTEHNIIITPSLTSRYNIKITGRDRNQIKEYLADTYATALDTLTD